MSTNLRVWTFAILVLGAGQIDTQTVIASETRFFLESWDDVQG
jgi:hypothetical protein